MTLELAEIVGVWPLGASLATVAVSGLRSSRRRLALNEALHELRRPLQALALAAPAAGGREPAVESSLRMAATALERLEREVNGEAAESPARQEPTPVRPLLEAAVARWGGLVAAGGGALTLCWRAGETQVAVERGQLARVLDNLIANAIEHGGPEIVVAGWVDGGRLRLAVGDDGRRRPRTRRGSLRGWASGRRRRGHGLRIVSRIAAAHGGRFRLRRSGRMTEALLELPLARPGER